ncbi:MAG: glycosyltransferase family 2 protein [Candidatus Delongbacteria bacterium]|nr:glycosyltransferase family 2 protein [Candidatus Delongbacteria bacterium]
MLSICIPIYNQFVSDLVKKLHEQGEKYTSHFEIILIDDCSDELYKSENKKLDDYGSVKYIELPENIGRAKIRNLFLDHTKSDYLLFLDCDSLIPGDSFVEKYMTEIDKKIQIVNGGRIYDKTIPPKNKRLRWKYGTLREGISSKSRNMHPNKSFMTNNFLISRTIMDKVKFDERISKYGHEDTLFGFELKKNNIQITHIDNPVINGDLETNEEFIKKTEEGLLNLMEIVKFLNFDKAFINDVKILRYMDSIKSLYLDKILKPIFIITLPLIKKILLSCNGNLKLFDIYKVGFMILRT